jgi:hypothetical protein
MVTVTLNTNEVYLSRLPDFVLCRNPHSRSMYVGYLQHGFNLFSFSGSKSVFIVMQTKLVCLHFPKRENDLFKFLELRSLHKVSRD